LNFLFEVRGQPFLTSKLKLEATGEADGAFNQNPIRDTRRRRRDEIHKLCCFDQAHPAGLTPGRENRK